MKLPEPVGVGVERGHSKLIFYFCPDCKHEFFYHENYPDKCPDCGCEINWNVIAKVNDYMRDSYFKDPVTFLEFIRQCNRIESPIRLVAIRDFKPGLTEFFEEQLSIVRGGGQIHYEDE